LEGYIAWWPLEGSIAQWPLEGCIAWWPLKGSVAWWAMEEEGLTPFYLFSLSPQQILLKPLIFSFDLKVLFYHGSRPLLTHSLPFSLAYKLRPCISM
jgi:hypothetical protein